MDGKSKDVTGRFKHRGNGQIYAAVGVCQLKVETHWVDAVVYCRDGELFCRRKRDFLTKFERCDP